MSLTPDIRKVLVEHYYPSTVAPSKEFKALSEIEDTELNLIWERLWQLFANTFVYDTDLVGVRRWETMLNIAPKPKSSIEERRQEILMRINTSPPYTERVLQNMLNSNFGTGAVDFNMLYDKYRLELHINNGSLHVSSKAYHFTRVIIPANIELLLLFSWLIKIPIKHEASSYQYINAVHNFWRQGALSKVCWDGRYRFDRAARWGGIAPDPDYRDRQTHKLSVYMSAAYTQNLKRGTAVNNYGGVFCFDGQHIFDYERPKTEFTTNKCTFAVMTKDGREIEGSLMTI